jgi:signal peptidase II
MTIRSVSVASLALDQVSKLAVLHFLKLGQSVTLIPGILYFTYIQNPGAAFGFLASTHAVWRIPFFIVITILAALVVYSFQRFVPSEKRIVRFSLGMIWGGAAGNFLDRLLYGKVVDFIDAGFHQYRWPVFNLADSCITIGLTLMFLDWLRNKPNLGR